MASQTGASIAYYALAAWLLWERLDEETRSLVAGVLVWYADRWSGEEPRNGVYVDTQCEENAWTSAGIGAACCLLPDHRHRERWLTGFTKWACNTATLPEDKRHRGDIFRTTTFHPDYTTENHAFVHPTYIKAGMHLRGFSAILFAMMGEPIPDCLLYAGRRRQCRRHDRLRFVRLARNRLPQQT
ncbi:hypothetical protein [Paenibacillus cymbidii]|uniref:hypothetical protein n=1 Tax=Paenibacillus cymbidii TaxID=1639034 RepID=UPI001080E406|nr:hypothetical protein [Paenibacillus cymbidii]